MIYRCQALRCSEDGASEREVSMRIVAGALASLIFGLSFASAARSQEIMIWHDKGEDGLKMINEMAAVYAKSHPGVTVKSLSMPTDQWFSRSIAALNTNTAPDIWLNDNTRIAPIQQTTGKLSDLKPQLDAIPAADRAFISGQDVGSGMYKDRLLM